uniref:ATP-dependent DNA helicase n=2 Tax=Cacopsylla melanoneura TaxID=428564 RepID=A0A8D8YMS1_9HEMI
MNIARANEDEEERAVRLENVRRTTGRRRSNTWAGKERSAFGYDRNFDYESDRTVHIGSMSSVCDQCGAKKWKDESKGLCCSSGKVKLEPLFSPPEPLKSLLFDSLPDSIAFRRLIRLYNAIFQMTSFGGKVLNENGYNPTYRVQGQVYHRIGSLIPASGEDPQFLQIYFVGNTADELQARLSINGCENLSPDIVSGLQDMLHEHNVYIRELKAAVETVARSSEYNVVIHADRKPPGAHPGVCNAPTTNEIAVVLVDQQNSNGRDVVLRLNDGTLHRIPETHRSYDCLQYPLMFCRGEDGYNLTGNLITLDSGRINKVSCSDWYAYRIMVRGGDNSNHLLFFGPLLSQFLVDMYAKMETERLNYLRFNQSKLRAAEYIDIQDALERDGDLHNMGRMVVLPSSFTAGPRYMQQKTQDALTYVRHHGRPDLFITFTCNPKWSDISEALFPGQKPEDRHDIVSRVFHLKVKKIMDLLVKFKVFGTVRCFMYSIEWQKRGLPHVHILVWLVDKISPHQVDSFISAEIPNKDQDPILFEIITKSMIHGPCGTLNATSPCMKDGKCSKKYPKSFVSETQTGEDGYPTYRRRSPAEGGETFALKLKNGVECDVDNRWVVPYCPLLSRLFKAHINVEYCHSVKSIKYVCKYVNKGSDQATFRVEQPEDSNPVRDEISNFQTGRYINTSEAVWRILSFPIHEHYPPVQSLHVHLENGQRVYFNPDNVSNLQNPRATTLTAFFHLCQVDDFAKSLLYSEVPKYYRFEEKDKKFVRRKRGEAVEGHPGVFRTDTIGRVYTVHPNLSECYFLRLLLHVVRGPESFVALRTVNGEVCPTFQEACQRSGLLENDDNWDKTLQEAALSEAPKRLRYLFAVMLSVCHVSQPLSLWENHKENLSEDILHNFRRLANDDSLGFSEEIFNQALLEIQKLLRTLGQKKLSDFGLPLPQNQIEAPRNVEQYNLGELNRYVQENESKLTSEQRKVYDEVLQSVQNVSGRLFFLDAPGGTGKTYLINLIIQKVRSSGQIVFAVASCGIAATLLQGGKTVHSTFKVPLNLNYHDQPVCNISRGSDLSNNIQNCALIVWDECTMSNKAAIEAVDRTLRDITGNNTPMGGITVLFSGDFRQTLPVVQKGTRADEVNACMKSSVLWSSIISLHLTKNMRVLLQRNVGSDDFSKLLLDLGDGKVPSIHHEIEIPNGLGKMVGHINELISSVYPNLKHLDRISSDWFCERSILSPKNEMVSAINDTLLNSCEGESMTYSSFDTTLNRDQAVNFPVEFLNSLELSGLPSHKITLKVGAPIMLLRNLDAPRLCNGTRLRVTRMQPNVIEAEILTGCAKGDKVFIPRIPMIPQDCPYEFKRVQLPIRVCFAMTINKSQGQTLKFAGIDLRSRCFSHGQLYVACSRVTSSEGLFILSSDNGKTSNIVYPEVLR